jgi:hypothetical protein
VLDLQTVVRGKLEITFDVTLRIDHRCRACLFVSNQVGSVGKAIQIKLLEDHGSPPCPAVDYSN